MENKNEINRNYLIILLPYFLFIQGIFLFYKIIPAIIKFYHPDSIFLIPYSFATIGGVAALATGFGILFKRQWGIVLYWTFCLIPILLMIILPQAKLPGIGEYWIIILNIIFAVYLSFRQWKKWKRI